MIDVQNTHLRREDPATLVGEALARWHRLTPFHERMRGVVIPTLRRKPGWNELLLPKDEWQSQIVPELAPRPD